MEEDLGFEKFPGNGELSAGQAKMAEEWSAAMSEGGVPEFQGEQFGIARPENEFYGEAKDDDMEVGEEYDEGIRGAAALINYGLNAAARDLGVEAVVQGVKSFDASGMDDPVLGLYQHLGVNMPEGLKEIKEEDSAAAASEAEFREGVNAPSQTKSKEGAIQAINDMKELISEVEGADPRYEELRAGARAAGRGYFEYAVSKFGTQGLTELFGVLAEQRETKEDDGDFEEENGEDNDVVGESGIEKEETDKGEFKESGEKKNEEDNFETLNPEILEKDI